MARWIIDSDHSVARFAIRHMMIANVEGLFGKIAGSVDFDPPEVGKLSAEAEIDVRSLASGNPQRDEHLLSSDFLDAEKYPTIGFKVSRVELVKGDHCRVTGDLTIRGVTRPVIFEMTYSGPVTSPFSGRKCVGFSAAARINREDYGLTSNEMMEAGGVVIGREVNVAFEIEADLAVE
jgi:polyisoprenoid-binding protein YceI